MIVYENIFRLIEQTCKAQQKWGLYLSFAYASEDIDKDFKLIRRSLRSRSLKKNVEIERILLCQGWVLLMLDTEKEMRRLFNGVDGEDTQGHIYACTCSPGGQLLNENT